MSLGNNSSAQLKSIIERIENLNTQIDDLKTDQKEIFAEAKSNGYDPSALRAVIKYRKEDADKRANREAILETYLHALGDLAETPLGRAAVERAVA
jgi:uncharacterized protein (UPF0335 family)